MCYFTDKDYVKKLKGIFPTDQIDRFGEVILKRALKLQIGCGTEPTLYKNLDQVIEKAAEYKVPHISMTTNANLIKKDQLERWAANGLSEMTISLHGVQKDTYEYMMGKGDFHKFLNAMYAISEVKKKYPITLRVNYTFNEDNFDELASFYDVFGDVDLDILQIRPIINMGNTAYQNFSLEKIIPKYDAVHEQLKAESVERGVQFFAHNFKQLQNRSSAHSVVKKYVYCYISPTYFYRNDFNWQTETYDDYAKRTNLSKRILKDVFASKETLQPFMDDKLNYTIN